VEEEKHNISLSKISYKARTKYVVSCIWRNYFIPLFQLLTLRLNINIFDTFATILLAGGKFHKTLFITKPRHYNNWAANNCPILRGEPRRRSCTSNGQWYCQEKWRLFKANIAVKMTSQCIHTSARLQISCSVLRLPKVIDNAPLKLLANTKVINFSLRCLAQTPLLPFVVQQVVDLIKNKLTTSRFVVQHSICWCLQTLFKSFFIRSVLTRRYIAH